MPATLGEKALAETKAQLHSLRVRIGRQEKSVENAQESLNRASEKLLHMRHEHGQLLAQFREMQSRLSPSSSKTPSVIGDAAPVIEEVGSTPMDEEVQAPPPPASGQAVEVSSDWPGPPSVDVFVENSDSTKRARVTLPSGSLLVDAVESGQFDEGEAKRMMAALCRNGVSAPPDAVPLRPEFPEEWEAESNL